MWLKPELVEPPQEGLTPSTLLVCRLTLEQIGRFDTRFPNASDVDWFFRARDAGVAMHTLPTVLVRKRIHAHNHSARITQLHAEYLGIARASLLRRRPASRGGGS